MSDDLALEPCGCPLGHEGEDPLVFIGADRMHRLPGRFCVVRCGTCGLLRTDPRPGPEAMSSYYPESYGPHQPSAEAEGRTLTARFARLTDTRAQLLPDLAPGRVLEVGCGTGEVLRHLARAGWDVTGQEVSKRAAELARSGGISVVECPISELPDADGSFDLVIAFMVLEHLHDLMSDLARIRALLGEGGRFVISVPNVGSLERRVFGSWWFGWQLPTHLQHFTPGTLTSTLNAAGFGVERVVHQRVASDWLDSLAYLAEARGWLGLGRRLRGLRRRRAVRLLTLPVAWVLAACRTSGRITVWASAR